MPFRETRMKTILTRNQGKMTLRGPLVTPGYKTKPQKQANGFAQSLMDRGSFSTPSTNAGGFTRQPHETPRGFGGGLKSGKGNF